MVTYSKSVKTTTLRKNRKRKESKVVPCIVEIGFDNGITIYVYEGTLSDNDLLVKFKDKRIFGTQERQPSHIHWAVDLLIKKDNQPELTDSFLRSMLERWHQIKPLGNREPQTVIDNLIISKNKNFVTKYQELNKFGFFTMEFITHLMEVLMLQEKTNRPDAYMFKDVVQRILEHKDLYAIISAATHRGI